MTRRHRYDDDYYADPEEESPGHGKFFFGFMAGVCAALILVTGGAMGVVTVFFFAAY